MTLPQFAAIIGLAILDSVNPTAVIVTCILLTRERTPNSNPVRAAYIYIASVLLTYAALAGIALTMVSVARGGLLTEMLESSASYWVQLFAAAALLWWAVWHSRQSSTESDGRVHRAFSLGSIVTVGVGVTVVEGLTALPMFAAVGIIGSMDTHLVVNAVLIVGYAVIFVAPLLVIVALHRRGWSAVDRFRNRLDRLRSERRTTTRWLVGLVGVILATDAIRVISGS